jgi:PAS domain S-box-containing protein
VKPAVARATAPPKMEGRAYDVLEAVPLPVSVLEAIRDPDGRATDFVVAYVNPAVVRLTGRAREELVGARLSAIVSRPSLVDEYLNVLNTGRPLVTQTTLDDERAALRGILEIDAVRMGDEVVTGLRDVTARVQAERRLRESKAQLAEAQRVAHFGSWEWDLGTGELTWSDELYRIYGVTPVDYRPTYENYLGRVHAEDRDHVGATIRTAAQSGETFTFEERVVRPDGTVRILQSGGGVVVDEQGRPVRMVGACHDVTEREQARRRLAEARAELELRRLAERQARKINDGIISALVEAVQALERGDVRGAERAMHKTLDHASRIVTELVGSDPA